MFLLLKPHLCFQHCRRAFHKCAEMPGSSPQKPDSQALLRAEYQPAALIAVPARTAKRSAARKPHGCAAVLDGRQPAAALPCNSCPRFLFPHMISVDRFIPNIQTNFVIPSNIDFTLRAHGDALDKLSQELFGVFVCMNMPANRSRHLNCILRELDS